MKAVVVVAVGFVLGLSSLPGMASNPCGTNAWTGRATDPDGKDVACYFNLERTADHATLCLSQEDQGFLFFKKVSCTDFSRPCRFSDSVQGGTVSGALDISGPDVIVFVMQNTSDEKFSASGMTNIKELQMAADVSNGTPRRYSWRFVDVNGKTFTYHCELGSSGATSNSATGTPSGATTNPTPTKPATPVGPTPSGRVTPAPATPKGPIEGPKTVDQLGDDDDGPVIELPGSEQPSAPSRPSGVQGTQGTKPTTGGTTVDQLDDDHGGEHVDPEPAPQTPN